jgi:hypothetical protein
MNQIEFLLRLSENAQDKGDEIATRQQTERAAHVTELLDLQRMATIALRNIEEELARFGVTKRTTPQPQQLPSKDPNPLAFGKEKVAGNQGKAP